MAIKNIFGVFYVHSEFFFLHYDNNFKREAVKINNPKSRVENLAGVMGKITLQVVIFAT